MKQLKSFFWRVANSFVVGFYAYQNPSAMTRASLKMCGDLLGLILKVAAEDRHMMTHIAYIHPDEGMKQIVSIWAGAGVGADPVKRISELQAEISKLKHLLNQHIDNGKVLDNEA